MRRFSNQHLRVLLLALVWPPATAAAQLAPLSERFVADLDPDYLGASSYPVVVGQLSRVTLLSANDGQHGIELWRTDGTAAGTLLLADLCPGSCSSMPQQRWTLGNRVFLAATQKAEGGRGSLWVTDGTSDGTRRLVDDFADSLSEPAIDEANGVAYFLNFPPVAAGQLWRTDGTVEGTMALTSDGTSAVGGLFVWRGWLFFRVGEPSGASALWRSDGTTAGTVRVRSFDSFRILGGARFGLVLEARIPSRGNELWILPTPPGRPMPLPQFSPGAASTAFYGFAVVSGRVVVATETSGGELQLYATDGSPARPTQLTRFTGAQELSTAPGLMRISDRRSAFEVGAGGKKELWSTNGTSKGTRRVAEVALPFSTGPSKTSLSSGGWLYFSGYRKAEGTEPWRTDGITAALLRDTCKGACSGFPSGFSESMGEIFFEAFSPARQPTYWHTGGGGSRIAAVLRPQSTTYTSSNILGVTDGALLVGRVTLHEGLEPWTWRPGVGFHPLRDINPTTSPADSNPRDFQAFDGKTVFLANDASLGPAVWVSDGTASGSRRLEARGQPTFERLAGSAATDAGLFLLAGQYQSGRGFPTRFFVGALWLWDGASPFVERLTPHGVRVAQGLVAVQNQLFFCANGVLWKSDGSVAGTRDLRDAVGDYCASVAGSMGGQAYFLTPMALWRTDGTSSGTTPVLALPSGIAPLGESSVLGSRIFFLARRTTGQSSCPNLELWRWDEIEGAQAIVLESQDCLLWLRASLSPLGPNRLLATAHSISSTTLTSETRLWLTDGTAAGTHFVARTAIPQTSQPKASAVTLPLLYGSTAESQPVVELAGRNFFMGPGDFTSRTLALWSSDGSVEGTRTHVDIVPPGYYPSDRVAIIFSPPPSSPWVAGGRVILEVEDATSKRFFLETMGTPGSTLLHGRVEGEGPGTAEGRLFFSRKNEHGNELWVLEAQP